MDYIFDYPRDWLRDWLKAQNHFEPDAEIHKPPIIAKDQKDIPDWLKHHHQWEPAVDVNKLKKYQLEVELCCSKCAEIVVEEILEVYGVFDVRAEHLENKVVVVAKPNGLEEHEVLMKARKIHKKAKFVELDAKEKPKDNKKKEDGEKGKGDNEGNKQGNKGNKETQANPSQSKSTVVPVVWPSWPIAINAPRFFYPPSQISHYPNTHGQLVQFI